MRDEGIVYKISLQVVPLFLSWIFRVLMATCRFQDHDVHHLESIVASGKAGIAAFWHYSLIMVVYRLRGYSAMAMVSSSRDGEYIARLLHRLGLKSARGSRNRKRVQALKELIKAAGQGTHCAIVADGSQGPALVAQPGAILLSAKTGSAILPMVCTASSYWTIRSWDRTIIPKPFSRINCFFSQPITVPPDIDSAGIEQFRLQLEIELQRLYAKAWAEQGKASHV